MDSLGISLKEDFRTTLVARTPRLNDKLSPGLYASIYAGFGVRLYPRLKRIGARLDSEIAGQF